MIEPAPIGSEEQARAYVAEWGNPAAIDLLGRFCDLLIEENRRQNLISKPSEAQLWQRHVSDSAQLLEHVPRETSPPGPWLDLGTGAGFPGLVIAALRPKWEVVLVESRSRRAEFLANCVKELDLRRCRVIGERLEKVHPFPAWVISARAFAPLDKLMRLSAPFSTEATRYVLPKGRSAAQELAQARKSIRQMFHVEHSLTDGEAGIIVSA